MCANTSDSADSKVTMPCYVCNKKLATKLRTYEVGRMIVRIWLCPDCILLDKRHILENTLGIPAYGELKS